MSALASLERFGQKDFSKNKDRADTVYKVNGLKAGIFFENFSPSKLEAYQRL